MTSTVSQLKKFPSESLAAYYSRSEIHFRRTEVEKDDEKASQPTAASRRKNRHAEDSSDDDEPVFMDSSEDESFDAYAERLVREKEVEQQDIEQKFKPVEKTADSNFTAPVGQGRVNGSLIMRNFSLKCGAKSPHLLRGTHLRRHAAVCAQYLNLNPEDLRQLSEALGHTTQTHLEHYRKPEAAIHLGRISMVMCALDKGIIHQFKNKKLDEIDIAALEKDEEDEGDEQTEDSTHDSHDQPTSSHDLYRDEQQTSGSLTDSQTDVNPNVSDSDYEMPPDSPIRTRKRKPVSRVRWDTPEKKALKGHFVVISVGSTNTEDEAMACDNEVKISEKYLDLARDSDSSGPEDSEKDSVYEPSDTPTESSFSSENKDDNLEDDLFMPVSPSVQSEKSGSLAWSIDLEVHDPSFTENDVNAACSPGPVHPDDHEIPAQQGDVYPVNGKSTKRIRAKEYCFYCEEHVLQFSRHIERNHINEMDVQQLLAYKKNSKERKRLLAVLRNKGNYLHSRSTNSIKLARKPILNRDSSQPLPCKYCLGFFARKHLWRHLKRCPKNGNPKEKPINCQNLAQNMLMKQIEGNNFLKNLVFPHMRADDITLTVKKDPLISAYGSRFAKTHQEKHHINIISRKMRELGKLLIEIRKGEPTVKTLLDALKPQHFDLLVEAAKRASKYDEKTNKYGSPTYAMNISTSLKECCEISCNFLYRNASFPDKESYERAEFDFKRLITMISSDWKYEVSHQAANDLHYSTMNRITIVPLASDLKKFKKYLQDLADDSFATLQVDENDESAYHHWIYLCLPIEEDTELAQKPLTRSTTSIQNTTRTEEDTTPQQDHLNVLKSLQLDTATATSEGHQFEEDLPSPRKSKRNWIKLTGRSSQKVEPPKLKSSGEKTRRGQYCVICKKPIVKLFRHLISQHSDNDRVAEALRSNPSEKRRLLDKIRREGKRVGGMMTITTEDYENKSRIREGTDIYNSLSKSEKISASRFYHLIIRGKLARPVPLLISNELAAAIDIILMYRRDAGVTPDNRALFGKGDGHSDANVAMREATFACGAESPGDITSTALRKHIASVTLAINMNEGGVKVVCSFLGNTKQTHMENYRLTNDAVNAARLSRLLTALDEGTIGDFNETSFDDIDVNLEVYGVFPVAPHWIRKNLQLPRRIYIRVNMRCAQGFSSRGKKIPQLLSQEPEIEENAAIEQSEDDLLLKAADQFCLYIDTNLPPDLDNEEHA
ncbi:hypothetical protein GE061_018735 [Apolygus lucorum]|uniref:Uncharacterized protein n=1 Tax=Apolygus lucorum TaxID=248454 RepID=A0A8S9XAK0_APOLU|nr:hypothetical protein GE061_018735 [Apolygus lucorum]